MRNTDDLINELFDLHRQATTEHSHYYTAELLAEAITAIDRLKAELSDASDTIRHLRMEVFELKRRP